MLLPQMLTIRRIMAGNMIDLLESKFLEKSDIEGAKIVLIIQ